MSSVSSARGKRQDPLSKRIPENPKFKHVRSTIDTGASITKHIAKLEEMKRDYKFRKGEIFKRMKVTTFTQLVVQVADYDSFSNHAVDSHSKGDGEEISSYRPDSADREVQKIQGVLDPTTASHTSLSMPSDPVTSNPSDSRTSVAHSVMSDSSRSRLQEVIRGVGEADLNSSNANTTKTLVNSSDCPYLLLDVRDSDQFSQCHIITAQSYPTAMLARSVNYESKDMLRFKNKEGKIIILYDNDESISHRAATTLVQRGYDNLFMLSGGLKVAARLFPTGLIAGTVPAWLTPEVNTGKGKSGSQHADISPAPVHKTDFTPEDLDCLVMYMDTALSDNSAASRLSKAKGSVTGRSSTASTTSGVSSTASFGSRRPPFKP